MNAVPISMNTADGASAVDASSTQTDKSSALPAFAQLLADKQSSDDTNAISCRNSAMARNSRAKTSESPDTTVPPASAKSQAKPATPTQESAAPLKKTDPKATLSVDSQAKQTPATMAAVGATAAMFGLLPAVNPAAIQVVLSSPKEAMPSADTHTAQDSSVTPAATKDTAAATSAEPLEPASTNSAVSQFLAPLPGFPVPHVSAQIVDSSEPLASGALAARSTNPAASNALSGNGLQAEPAASLDPNAQTLQPPPLSDAQTIPAESQESAAPIAKNTANDSAKPQIASSANQKSTVADILRNFASAAGKTAETVAHLTAAATRDLASSIKEKTSTNAISLASASLSNPAAKAQQPPIAKQEPAGASLQVPSKTNPARSTSNSSDTPDNSDTPSAGNDNFGSPEANPKAKGPIVDAPSPQAGQPLQAPAANSALIPAAGLSSIASPKESVDTKPATAAQESNPAATPDSDDAKLPSIDSKGISVSQLTGSDTHSEVRIAMQADQLGQVELHATLNGQLVGAAITVEKKEAHAAMAVELPSLQQALEEKNLRVSEVVLSQSTMHSTSGDASRGGNAPAEQRENPIGRQYELPKVENDYPAAPSAGFETAAIFDGYGRLSVRV